jgi:hypothetical protein
MRQKRSRSIKILILRATGSVIYVGAHPVYTSIVSNLFQNWILSSNVKSQENCLFFIPAGYAVIILKFIRKEILRLLTYMFGKVALLEKSLAEKEEEIKAKEEKVEEWQRKCSELQSSKDIWYLIRQSHCLAKLKENKDNDQEEGQQSYHWGVVWTVDSHEGITIKQEVKKRQT